MSTGRQCSTRAPGSTRAQLKLGESIVILIIFFFLLMFGMVAYVKWSITEADRRATEAKSLIAVSTVQLVSFLPELQCTVEGNEDYNCVDLYKAKAISGVPDTQKAIYGTMFPRTQIILHKIFPEAEQIPLYGGQHSGNSYFFPVPVAIYDPEADLYYFGYINLTVYP